jgi:ATP dependent DNA ligase domain
MAQDIDEAAPAAQTLPDDGPRALLRTLRPQIYGKESPNKIVDPIIEPLWIGVRSLAGVDLEGAAIVDEDGVVVEGFDDITGSLVEMLRATGLVLDGFLTRQATQTAGLVGAWSDETPTMGSFIGLRRNRAVDTLKLREDALAARDFSIDDAISYVATDLLWVDDTSLVDIPLLERRRILESVLGESDLVRMGAFIRPPILSWVGSWKAQGFDGLTYKAANSRYHPGQMKRDWTIGGMPRR